MLSGALGSLLFLTGATLPAALEKSASGRTSLPAEERALPPGPGPLDNPLKGFAAYAGPNVQHHAPVSMAYFNVSWRDLEPEEGQYRFEEWERREWETPLAKGKPVVFRVYLDYPGLPTGVPQWLLDKGVRMTPYTGHGGGRSPDYDNPELQRGLQRMIAALGKRYDRNPRVAFVQVGLLGHWGEWHTWPTTELFPSEKTQRLVLDALRQAFPNKHLMARNPAYPSAQLSWIGYHDDMIPDDTLGPEDWKFLPSLRAAGRQENWKVAPTGGEMVPGAALRYMGADWPMLMRAVEEAHFTWIGPYAPPLVSPPDETYRQRTEELIRKLGYEYRLSRVRLPSALRAGERLSFSLEGKNQGVAPFYYRWPVELALLAQDGTVAQRWTLRDDIRRWLPGEFRLQAQLPLRARPGTYRIGLGIIDPGKSRPAIRFANRLPVVHGYTVLGPIRVSGPAPKKRTGNRRV